MDKNAQQPYTYMDSGYNSFMSRGLNAKQAVTLRALSQAAPRQEINFDHYQTSGNLGDKIQVGGITIDGSNRRIVIVDEAGNEVGWIGKINNG